MTLWPEEQSPLEEAFNQAATLAVSHRFTVLSEEEAATWTPGDGLEPWFIVVECYGPGEEGPA